MSTDSAPYTEIEAVAFAVAGDDDNLRDSVVEVQSYELFSGEQPVSEGAFDARMGTTDHHISCLTCGHQRRDDPGHPGRIRSRVGLSSPLFIAEIRRWLKVVCLGCGAPVVDLGKFAGVGRARRLAEAAKTATEGIRCMSCKEIHPKIVAAEDDYFTFYAELPQRKAAKRWKLRPDQIRAAFERVRPETVAALGRPASFHPRNLVLRVVLVPPNTIRPGVRMGYGPAGATSYHDLTNLIQYLIKRNLQLPEAVPPEISEALDRDMQNAQQVYYEMILGAAATNASQGSTGKRGLVVGSRKVRSIVRNFPRKDGRIRKNLLGKRVWNITRSTISGNPSLRSDQVGFPLAFARVVQIEETVQEYNRDRLMTYFLNGRRQYPGCSRVVKRATGAVHRVEGLRRDFQLEVGDRIERDVITGDFAFFNRQPSLERSSIGVHSVVVLEDPSIHTFQINVTACDWYNADFDGDQMNLWVPHRVMARAEAELMSSVSNWFISTKTSGPVNGQVQDSNVGSFELTRSTALADKFHAMRLFAGTRMAPPRFERDGVYTGREIASLLFETAPVNYDRPSKWYDEALAPYVDYDPQETRTVVKRGKLISGVLDSSSVGAGASGGLFHLISREYGPRRALDMIYALQQIAIQFVDGRGFTVSTADMVVSPAGLADIQQIVAGILRESELITERLIRGELVPPIGMTTHEFYERLQLEALKAPDELLRPVMGSIDPDRNGLFKMIATGSKGSKPNLLHIAAEIGQISINTQRITEQFGFRRTNVYFPRFATSPQAYGFVADCYISGMTSSEYIFSDMNGRFDLINKALSTASTGYANRKAIMSLQSGLLDNYRRVSTDTRVVQFLYGEDGLDPRRIERVRFRTVFASDDELRARYRLDLAAAGVAGASAAAQAVFDRAFERVHADRDWYRAAYLRFEDTDFSSPLTDSRQVPVNVARLVRDVVIAGEGEETARPDAEELVAMHGRVEDFCERLAYIFVNEIQERRRAPVPPHLAAATRLMQMLLRSELAGPVLARLSPAQLDFVLDAARLHYSRALADYGTAVGILAAQAVSEPLTQYMLDSHHRSVGSGTNKSGIIRPAEIFGAKPVEAEQSPEMLLRVLPELEGDRSKVLQVANQIELMLFDRFVSRWALLLEAYGDLRYPPFAGDREWIAEFERNHPLLAPPDDLTSWCARFELDKATMILKSMSLETIVERLRAKHPNAHVIHSPENVASVVLRVYFRAGQIRRGQGSEEEKVKDFIRRPGGRDPKTPVLLETVIRGVPGVLTTSVVEVKRHKVEADGVMRLGTVYAIATTGTNIYGVLTNRSIDSARIVSSSIGDTQAMFGIAAARTSIVREIRRFMGSKAPNPRHLLVYADVMTRTGQVTAIEKSGINVRERDNTLLRMSMSSPTQVLQDAALNGTAGRLYGVSSYLVAGRAPPLGTTWNDVEMDEEFVRANTKSVDDVLSGL